MLKERLIVVIFLVPLGVSLVAVGGWFFNIAMTAMLAVAAWEYWRIFINGGYSPSRVLLIGGVALLGLSRAIFGFQYSDLVISLLIIANLVWFVVDFEKGAKLSAIDYGITLAGTFYLGWLGSYLITLRTLPDGTYWLLLTISAIALADGGAYLIGKQFGVHKMSARVSPQKSWEGYFGGIVFSALLTSLIGGLWHQQVASISWQDGFILALVMGILGPLGDLAESLFKRQFCIKDSSNIIPGHGGIMDRIDTWIWAAVIGYYMITLLKLAG